MVSLDLSRAFDLLSRSALDLAMQAAAVPEALRTAVLAVHESCKYSVTHGTYRDTFELQVGVRLCCMLCTRHGCMNRSLPRPPNSGHLPF